MTTHYWRRYKNLWGALTITLQSTHGQCIVSEQRRPRRWQSTQQGRKEYGQPSLVDEVVVVELSWQTLCIFHTYGKTLFCLERAFGASKVRVYGNSTVRTYAAHWFVRMTAYMTLTVNRRHIIIKPSWFDNSLPWPSIIQTLLCAANSPVSQPVGCAKNVSRYVRLCCSCLLHENLYFP